MADVLTLSPVKPTHPRRKREGDEEGAEDAIKDGDITELTEIDVERIDGVAVPANGFPPLLLIKQAATGGGPAVQQSASDLEEDTTAKGGDATSAPAGSPAGDAGAQPDGDLAVTKDGAGDGDNDADDGAPGEDVDGSGDSHGDGDDDDKATKAAGDTRDGASAYAEARAEWLTREPVTKGVHTGTEYLQTVASWKRWHAEGEAEGLDGTAEGRGRWLTKHVPGTVAKDETGEGAGLEVFKAAAVAEEAVLGVEKRKFTAERRRELASQHHALSDGSYPIENTEDLGNAATLARSGHGDVSGAKQLIRRRAKELGVPNPLKGDGKASKSETATDGTAPVAETSTPGEKAAAQEALAETLGKAMGAGLISQAAYDEILAQAGVTGKGLPADVKPAGEHREPDGTSTVERLEPDAGLPTDKDKTPDKVPASVEKQTPYSVLRMHDALCAAFPPETVLAEYPALKSITAAIDPGWFSAQAAEAAAEDAQKAAGLTTLAGQAQALKMTDPAAVDDARAALTKAFTSQYPDAKLSPSAPRQPGSFKRPYLSAGHASEHAGQGPGGGVPDATHTPEPQDYQRGYLTEGHAAMSPGNHGPNNPNPPDAGGRSYYATSEQQMASAAMRSMHDHIAATFAGACPMAPSREAMPGDMHTSSGPRPAKFTDQGGISTVKATSDGDSASADGENKLPWLQPKDGDGPPKKKGKRKARKALLDALAEASEAGARNALKAMQATLPDTASLTSVVAEQIATLTGRYDTEIEGLRKQVDELGSQPDPALAPVRGQMARAGNGTAAPVEKRSLIDEAAQARKAAAEQERADYLEYVRKQAQSPDPKTREAAQRILDQIEGGAAGVPA